MIVLDTNVVSEPMKPLPCTSVTAWLNRQAVETLYFTATSFSELLLGIELLPDGKRKAGLGESLRETVAQLFGDRILPFTRDASPYYAAVVGKARRSGRSLSVADAQIAAIAALHGFIVATRDAGAFVVAGVGVVNPWTDETS